MPAYDAHGLPYFISSSGVMQFREVCYTVVSYAPYILLQTYAIKNLATFRVTILDIFHPGPQPMVHEQIHKECQKVSECDQEIPQSQSADNQQHRQEELHDNYSNKTSKRQ